MHTIIEPFKIKVVEPIKFTTEKERKNILKKAYYNTFQIDSENVLIDLLTDSGTSAMSQNQWAAMMQGDESYAGAKSYRRLEKVVKELTGMNYFFPTHQGRAAERILYGVLSKKKKIFISNTHFDTTRANIEYSGGTAIDIPCKEAKDTDSEFPFKGNIDLEKLEELLKKHKNNVGAVILTVTNNSGGGQPVSMKNAKEASYLCKKYHTLFVLDCCRIAENAWFIKEREKGFEKKSYEDIAKEMFRLADAAVMSAKKDGLVNMGGFLTLNDGNLADECKNLLIITEGFTTYGGLSGRDMEALAVGLKEVFDKDYLQYRIKSTAYLGEHLFKLGIPVMRPFGGHAIYVDAKRMYEHIPSENFPGQVLVTELYEKGGIRSVEIGSLMFGKKLNGKFIPANWELVRLAIPRRVYTQSHIEYIIEVFENLKKKKINIKGYKVIYEPPFLRHFTCKLQPIK
ncbi:MAG TPA: tryptophanase [Bacteroidia bacterium]|nr:tryptophanase [Bacteroidia bacterium]